MSAIRGPSGIREHIETFIEYRRVDAEELAARLRMARFAYRANRRFRVSRKRALQLAWKVLTR